MIENIYLELAKEFKRLRHALALTQEEAAIVIYDMSRETVANTESGKRRMLYHDVSRVRNNFDSLIRKRKSFELYYKKKEKALNERNKADKNRNRMHARQVISKHAPLRDSYKFDSNREQYPGIKRAHPFSDARNALPNLATGEGRLRA